jgi:hypothetical protein
MSSRSARWRTAVPGGALRRPRPAKESPFVVTLASGDSHPATAIGRDAANDLAVIRITRLRDR